MATVVEEQEISAPTDQAGVVDALRAAFEASRAVYPLGGGTAQNYGCAPSTAGTQLDLTGLKRIVDYTPRDMTILVEAGVRMADLATALAAEGQHLPIDVPRASEASIGGVVATNWNGPRRFGHGTIRDYVIGIHAVDGRGVAFKGGGRVVKNVAGYDFCKLLCGSLGTLGVITQLALKVKPPLEQSAAVIAACPDVSTAESILTKLIDLPAPPVSIDIVAGPAWELEAPIRNPQSPTPNPTAIVVRVEGTEPEVAWLADRLQDELRKAGGTDVRRLDQADAAALWRRQVEFTDRGAGDAPDSTPLAIKIAVPPSAVTPMVAQLIEHDPACAIQAHAGNGIIHARFSEFKQADLTRVLVGKLRPAAINLGGSLIVVATTLEGLTPHLIWGGRTDTTVLLERVKQKFDPRNILNPGRFVF